MADYRRFAQRFGIHRYESDPSYYIGRPLESLIKTDAARPPIDRDHARDDLEELELL